MRSLLKKARTVSAGIIVVLVVFFLLVHPHSPYGEEDQDALPIVSEERFPAAFIGDGFWYDISFLWFTKAAEAHMYFEKGERPSEYRAVLDAETKGFIGWLSSYRRQRYVSVMELVNTEKGKMLRSNYFSQEIISGEKSRITEFMLDYSKKEIETRESRTGKKTVISRGIIPDSVIYNDLLSAYYNLRGGVFGVKRKGETFKIATVPRKGVSHITVTIADGGAEKERKIGMEGARFLVRLDVDRRLFGQMDGIVWVWTDEDFVPVMGEVKDVSFFGDVRGYKKDQ